VSWHESLKYFLEKGLQSNADSCAWCRGRIWQEKLIRQQTMLEIKPPSIQQLCRRCAAEIPWIEQVTCNICGRAEPCGDCVRRRNSNLGINRSAVKYSQQMKEWLARYKYRGDERLASLFQEMMVYAYRRLMFDNIRSGGRLGQCEPVTILTYVPLSDERLRERGFNQARDMAAGIGRRLHLPIVPLLRRTQDTDKQSYKKRRDRYDSLVGIFQIHETGWKEMITIGQRHWNRRKRYILRPPSTEIRVIQLVIVDDVYTTGSTLQHCAKIIREAYSHELTELGIQLSIDAVTWAR
jgi:competence protein ComFC